MKPLLFSILFLFFYTINPFAQDRRIIFPENKTISHEDSMGIILIDHIYNGRKEMAVEMLKSGKVGGHVQDINENYAIQHAMQQFDTNMISLLIEKGALLQHSQYPVFLWKDFCNEKRKENYQIIEFIFCGTRGRELPKLTYPPDTIIADYLTRKHLKTVNAAISRSDMTDYFLMRGNASMTKKFLDRGVLFTDSFQTFNSPIIAACLSGDFNLFKLFVDKGYKIREETATGQNALHFACLGGESRIINYLIDKGVEMNKSSYYSYKYYKYYTLSTPFLCLLAGKLKSPDAIQTFFDKGVKLKKSDYWVYLFKSRYNYLPKPDPENMYKAVEILLQNGISPNYEGEFIANSNNIGEPYYSKLFYNSIMHLTSSFSISDINTLRICLLLIKNNLNLKYHDNHTQDDVFLILCLAHELGSEYSYFRTIKWLTSICPYYKPWEIPNNIIYDPGKIPYKVGYLNPQQYYLDEN